MNRTVQLQPLPSVEEFAPFGTFIRRPDNHGERRFFSDWLGGEGLAPVFHVNSMAPTVLPAPITKLERHPHAAQCFVPLDVERYIVTVAPSLADGSPDLDGLRSFIVPSSLGTIYRSTVWHAGASVLDRAGAFAVLMWRGRDNDDEFVDIPAVTIVSQD